VRCAGNGMTPPGRSRLADGELGSIPSVNPHERCVGNGAAGNGLPIHNNRIMPQAQWTEHTNRESGMHVETSGVRELAVAGVPCICRVLDVISGADSEDEQASKSGRCGRGAMLRRCVLPSVEKKALGSRSCSSASYWCNPLEGSGHRCSPGSRLNHIGASA